MPKPETPPAEAPENMGAIAKAAEERAQALVQVARQSNAKAEEALAELAASPLMVNGLGKAMKEAHVTAETQDARLQGLLQRIHEHFHPKKEAPDA